MRLETQALAEQYRDRLFAAAFQVCGNAADAEDAAQEALLRYHLSDKEFENQEHIRAWLLRVAINWAKNISRSFWRRNTVPLEDYMETLEAGEQLPLVGREDRAHEKCARFFADFSGAGAKNNSAKCTKIAQKLCKFS